MTACVVFSVIMNQQQKLLHIVNIHGVNVDNV